MTHLEAKDWILFASAFLFGVIGALLNTYFLILVSLLIMLISLSISKKVKRHELSFLFPLSFISYLPLNLKFSTILAELVDYSYGFTIRRLFYFALFLLVLISVEELVLGVLGVAIWGKQEAIFYKDEEQEESETYGHYLREITVDELFKR